MFRIEMLPAAHGDCLWIEYGHGSEVHRILIDGGPYHTYPALRERILHLPSDDRRFDLLVVTHIDADHIEGIIRLLQDTGALSCRFDRIWFNGREQLNAIHDPAGEPLGGVQGEYLEILIRDYLAADPDATWNAEFADEVVAVDPHSGALPDPVDLPGGCRLTLLSPTLDRLLALKDTWRKDLIKAKVASGDEASLRAKLEGDSRLKPLGDVLGEEDETGPDRREFPDPRDRDVVSAFADELGDGDGEAGGDADFGCDNSNPNGSSIAFLLEYPADDPEVWFLLTGDAWPSVLEESIGLLGFGPDSPLRLTGIKVPHHGSVANVTESFLSSIRCKHYLISTSGVSFGHPHRRTIDLLLEMHSHQAFARLHFNYLTQTTEAWAEEPTGGSQRFVPHHPKGLSVEP